MIVQTQVFVRRSTLDQTANTIQEIVAATNGFLATLPINRVLDVRVHSASVATDLSDH